MRIQSPRRVPWLLLLVMTAALAVAVGCGRSSEPTATPQTGLFILDITSPASEESFADTGSIVVRGRTRPDAVLSVGATFVEPDVEGNFAVTVQLEEGPNTIEVVASIASGEELTKILTIIYAP